MWTKTLVLIGAGTLALALTSEARAAGRSPRAHLPNATRNFIHHSMERTADAVRPQVTRPYALRGEDRERHVNPFETPARQAELWARPIGH